MLSETKNAVWVGSVSLYFSFFWGWELVPFCDVGKRSCASLHADERNVVMLLIGALTLFAIPAGGGTWRSDIEGIDDRELGGSCNSLNIFGPRRWHLSMN